MSSGAETGSAPAQLAAPPALLADLVGDRADLMARLAVILATRGVDHGLVGPREVPRLWDRHIVNCVLLAQLLPQGARVIDVGSGAGLPGLVLAVARPDLRLDLVEPLERRVRWLHDAIDELGIGDSVHVHRGKAQAFWGELSADVVTARAVARLGELAQWCLPLVPLGGTLLAMKGAAAQREMQEDASAVRAAGGGDVDLITLGSDLVETPTRVVRVVRVSDAAADRRASGRRAARGSRATGAASGSAGGRSAGRRSGRAAPRAARRRPGGDTPDSPNSPGRAKD